MILLRANTELHQTFERLIEAMKVPVKWNGIFVVIDNYMILQGEVRSLFFHFDTRNVATNIIDIPVKEDEIGEVGTNMRVQNAINLILYAFGKWGTIKGVRVDKSFEQLNTLFTDIMKEMQVEPEYTPSYLRFYRSGMRITYEDVIQTAQEEEQAQPEDEETNEGGLWHKVVWKRAQAEFARADITVSERRKSRIGNNFYLVGYLCPACCGKLHMAVYPAGKEFKIETEEGGVLLARAATCNACRRFTRRVPADCSRRAIFTRWILRRTTRRMTIIWSFWGEMPTGCPTITRMSMPTEDGRIWRRTGRNPWRISATHCRNCRILR